MNMQLHSTGASFVAAKEKNNPRDLVAKIIEKMESAERSEQFEAFRTMLAKRSDEYQRAVDWYFFVNMHDYMTTNRNRRRDPIERAEALAEKHDRVKSIVAQIVLLDLTMPNGMALRDCTFAECAKFGGFFAKIAKKGKPKQIVGKVMTEEQLQALR